MQEYKILLRDYFLKGRELMINYEKFTKTANSAVNAAFNQAERLGHTYMGSEHLLIGILCEGTAKIILRTNGICYVTIDR